MKRAQELYTAQAILAKLRQNSAGLKALGVKRIGLFGSYVRGEATSESDIDFLVDLSNESWRTYTDVLFFLEDLFHSEIDLVMTDALAPRIRPYILDEVLYAA